MKRSELRARFQAVVTDVKQRIQLNPFRAVVFGLVIGLLCGLMFRLFVSAIFICAVAGVVLWLIAEDDERRASAGSDTPSNPENL